MKITILTENLKKYLSIVSRGVSSRPSLPVLSGVLLKADSDGLSIVSTDLEIGFWIKARAKVEEPGEIVLPAKLFFDLVTSLPLGAVGLETEGEKMKVSVGKVQADILGQSGEDFPAIPRSNKIKMSVGSGRFSEAIAKVTISAAKDDTRPVLTGVLWQIDGDGVLMAATDGYRLSVDRLKVDGVGENKDTKLILPAKSLQEVAKVAHDLGEEEIGIDYDKENQQVVFVMDEVEVSSRLVAGEFPPYQQIMPNTYKTKVGFDRVEMQEAVKRAKLFAKDNANIVKLEIGDEGCVVRAESAQIGKNSSEVEIEMEGEKLTVAFNAQYLLDYLAACPDKRVTWETEGELKPSVFRCDDINWIQVVMPVRVQG